MIRYTLATPADDADLRALLREQGMPSWVEMTLEREPSFFAGAGWFGQERAVIAREGNDVVGMCTAARQRLFLDGQPASVDYLGGLRVHPRWRGNVRTLRGGFRQLETAEPRAAARGDNLVDGSPLKGEPADFRFTSIAAENLRARRLLEAGLPGFPRYLPIGRLDTLALPRARCAARSSWQRPEDAAELVAFHNREVARTQLAPVLSEEMVSRVGLSNFRVQRRGSELRACAGFWNQQPVRQIVARRYAPWLRRLLPLYNLLARWTGRVPLPPQGGQLDHCFLAFLAFAPELRPRTAELVRELLRDCPTPVASLGTDGHSPLARIASFTFRAHLYAVSSPAAANPRPEAALL